jgi:hypothetical protein
LSKTAGVAISNSTTTFSALYRNFFKNCIAYSVSGDSVLDNIALINGTLALPEPMSCLEVNPKFVNPDDGDFRLQPDSPALNAGYRDLFGGFQSIGPYDMRASNLSKGHK